MGKSEQLSSRIEQLAKQNGGSINALAQKADVDPSSLSKIVRGKLGLSAANAKKLAKACGVSEAWLVYGEGEIDALPVFFERHAGIPLVGQYAYAGYLTGYGDNEYIGTLPTIDFTPDREMTGNWLAFEVKGDSMEDGSIDSYVEGEIVICREVERDYWKDSRLFINKRDFVIVHEEGVLIKRIIEHNVERHTITIHSLNPMYQDRVLDLAQVKQIFSIVESRKQRRR
jgi:SOS-response transcriptional repressor LexA